jgi:hypothetical protein
LRIPVLTQSFILCLPLGYFGQQAIKDYKDHKAPATLEATLFLRHQTHQPTFPATTSVSDATRIMLPQALLVPCGLYNP